MRRVGRREFTSLLAAGVFAGCVQGEGEPDVSASASRDTVSLPRNSLEVTLSNSGDGVFEARKMGLAKMVEGEPRHVLPMHSHREDFLSASVGTGDSRTWEIEVDNGSRDYVLSDGVTQLSDLGPGVYRFAPGGIDEEAGLDGENMGFDMYHEHSVDVEFTGEYPELEPIDPDAYEVEREDGVVSVDHGEDADGSEVVVRRLEDADEGAREVIFEQVMRVTGLRNTLAFFDDDVTEVRHSPAVSTDAYGVEERFRFDGWTYEVEHRGG